MLILEITRYEGATKMSLLGNICLILIALFFGISSVFAVWHGLQDVIYKKYRNKREKLNLKKEGN